MGKDNEKPGTRGIVQEHHVRYVFLRRVYRWFVQDGGNHIN